MQDWSGLYDRSYYGDSGEKRQEFHRGSQAIMREQVKQYCEMGTMACNEPALARRREKYVKELGGLRKYNTQRGPGFSQFFYVTQDQSWKPLGEKMQGGVITDFRVAQHLLKQREADFRNQAAAREGLPPVASEMLELTPEESQSLELNNLLTELDDSIEQGTFSQVEVNNLKNIARILVRLAPTFSSQRLVDLIGYFESLDPSIDILNEGGNRFAPTLKRFVGTFINTPSKKESSGMLGFLHDMLDTVNLSLEQRKIAARSAVNQRFKLFSPSDRRVLLTELKERREIFKRAAEEKAAREGATVTLNELQRAELMAYNIPTDESLNASMSGTGNVTDAAKSVARAIRAKYKSITGKAPKPKDYPTKLNTLREKTIDLLDELRDLKNELPAEPAPEPPAEVSAPAPEPPAPAEGSAKRFKIERLNRL